MELCVVTIKAGKVDSSASDVYFMDVCASDDDDDDEEEAQIEN